MDFHGINSKNKNKEISELINKCDKTNLLLGTIRVFTVTMKRCRKKLTAIKKIIIIN